MTAAWSGVKSLLVASPVSSGVSSLFPHLWGMCQSTLQSALGFPLTHLSLGLAVQLHGHVDAPLRTHIEGPRRLALQLIMRVSATPAHLWRMQVESALGGEAGRIHVGPYSPTASQARSLDPKSAWFAPYDNLALVQAWTLPKCLRDQVIFFPAFWA